MTNNGILTSKMAGNAGISRSSLTYLVSVGELDRVERGVYRIPGFWDDEFFLLQRRYQKGIYSLGTALYLLDLSDMTPVCFHMTFPHGYNCTQVKEAMPGGVLCHTIKHDWYDLGVCTIKSPSGRDIRAYNAERSLCDILRSRNRPDIQLVVDALREYTGDIKRRNIPLLSRYAKTLGVEKKLQPYLEILL